MEEMLTSKPRELTSHKVNGLNEAIRVLALDDPGPGGANHAYVVQVPISPTAIRNTQVRFQKGPIAEAGINGLSNEALLAIVEDRLKGFQNGPFACEKNRAALMYLQTAMERLRERTQERVERGVEGTSVP